jgi:hypothetical protein
MNTARRRRKSPRWRWRCLPGGAFVVYTAVVVDVLARGLQRPMRRCEGEVREERTDQDQCPTFIEASYIALHMEDGEYVRHLPEGWYSSDAGKCANERSNPRLCGERSGVRPKCHLPDMMV